MLSEEVSKVRDFECRFIRCANSGAVTERDPVAGEGFMAVFITSTIEELLGAVEKLLQLPLEILPYSKIAIKWTFLRNPALRSNYSRSQCSSTMSMRIYLQYVLYASVAA